LLKGYSLVWKDQSSDIVEDLVGPARADPLEVLDLLVVDFLTEPQLDHTSIEGVQVVED
jgi:hypothetical protein